MSEFLEPPNKVWDDVVGTVYFAALIKGTDSVKSNTRQD